MFLPNPINHSLALRSTDSQDEESMSLDQCIVAWLNEKKGKSESEKTHKSYDTTLKDFRAALLSRGSDLDASPKLVALAAQGWAGHTKNEDKSGVSWATYNQRLACISSFYEYAIRFDVLPYNPIERVKRRSIGSKNAAARPIPEKAVKSGMQDIDRSTPTGLRDHALLSVALATGRRVNELAGMRYGHIQKTGDTCIVQWPRCKGNKKMQDELPPKTTKALYTYLYEVYGPALGTLPGNAPIWVSFSRRNERQAIGRQTISAICEKHLKTSKVHATRHTWAETMGKRGATLQQIGKGLGHSNLKTTSDYMEELQGYKNPYSSDLEEAFGI